MPRTLVTGGAGFLGSHLCEFLLAKGHEVICMDSLVTGKESNIQHLKGRDFQFVKHDVTSYIEVKGKLDYILHFASPASPIDYQKIPIQTLKANSLGTHNALGLALAKKARILLASTSEVYGDPEVHPQPESYWGHVNPVGPRGCYDEGKRFAEALATAYLQIHKLETRIARIFNTYGPRMRANDGRAVPTFLMQALKNEPLTIFGDGSQTRSFCYVDDLIDGIYRLLMSDITEPVNLGNPDELTLLALAKKIVSVTKSTSPIVFRPLPVDDPHKRQPHIQRAVQKLGWKPTVSIDEGLRCSLDYFRSVSFIK